MFLHETPAGEITGGTVTKLLDFGIAKLMSDPRLALTSDDEVVGTPAYMAPERIAGGTIDGRSDVYAAGVLLYRALTGGNPFSGDDAREVAHQHVQVHPRALTTHDEEVSADFDALVQRMIAKDPGARPTAAEAAAALREMTQTLPDRPLRSVQRAALGATKTTGPP